MSWVWLNIPLSALVFLAIAGIPMWLVLKHPDERPGRARMMRPATVPAQPAMAVQATARQAAARQGAALRARTSATH